VGVFVGEAAREGAATYLAALGKADCLVAHNLKFDLHQTRETLGFDLMNLPGIEFHDTDLMSRVLMPEGQRKDRGGHGLKNLARVFLRADADAEEKAIIALYQKLTGKRSMKHNGAYYEVWRAHPEALEAYALKDTRYTYDLARYFLEKFGDDEQLWNLYNLERQVQRVLYRAEQRGVRVDPEAVARLKAHYEERRVAAEARLAETLGFVPEGEGSEAALAERLVEQGVDLQETTPTGQLAVNMSALRAFEHHPSVASLFEWRRCQKMLQTYIAAFEGRVVLHPDFQQAEAWTGRMSCRNPNMQNLPKRTDVGVDENLRLRSMIVPREGHYFVVADFEAVEMRVLAHYLGVPWYRDLVEHGDPHARTASVIWGGEPEDYGKGTDQRWLRDVAKHVTFAITYGAGGAKVRETINKMVPEEYRVDVDWVKSHPRDTPPKAIAIKNQIIGSIPGFRALADTSKRSPGRLVRQVRAKGYVRTIGGRKNLVDPEKDYVALSAEIQGSAADIMKLAAVRLADTRGEPLLFVHDEVLMEFPDEVPEDEAVAEVVEAMESAIELKPPLKVEAKVTRESYAHA
jgi:DNA polymerase-1